MATVHHSGDIATPIEDEPSLGAGSIWAEKGRSLKWVELIAGATALAVAIFTASILLAQGPESEPLRPHEAAMLLVANLLPATAILVLIGRRFALRRALENAIKSREMIHVRLVAIFSLIAAVPTLLLVIFASFLFQSGVQFWFSDSARGMLENAGALAEGYYREKLDDVGSETVTMASDLRFFLTQTNTDDPDFLDAYFKQVLSRKLSESAIVTIGEDGAQQTTALVSPDETRPDNWIDADTLSQLEGDKDLVVSVKGDGIVAVTRLYETPAQTYLYTKRTGDVPSFALGGKAQSVLRDYQDMVNRSQNLQFQFNIALYFVSLLIIATAVWVALQVADRLIKPVNSLVDAAQRIAEGDLSARVQEEADRRDEVAILGRSFNQMTQRLETQTDTLLQANQALDERRAFTEAVLESVSSGVISTDHDLNVTLGNSQAEMLLGEGRSIVGRRLSHIAPRFVDLITDEQRRGVVQLSDGPDALTLAVQISKAPSGAVITFEDISQQLADQRRAAWSDVARRIAHEIKNPLTPIQLAAERLQRRFAKEISDEKDSKAVFEQLTQTIVRQVGDLRKIADEFSSFARMPQPVFREENFTDIVRQAVFLFEVGHSDIEFSFDSGLPQVDMVCDRRQIAQTVTNLLKNAAEAIGETCGEVGGEAGGETGGETSDAAGSNYSGRISVQLAENDHQVTLQITDNGPGFPEQRDRVLEPYFTGKQAGTGLGLAIVKKIVEEHYGEIDLCDSNDGGACVRLIFNSAKLAAHGRSITATGELPQQSPS